jgi:helix-turn-helix, Psq domain/Tc5 transposase DNA-binding domain
MATLHIPELPYEARLVMAIEAIQGSGNISLRAAARIYRVSRSTLHARVHGRPIRDEIPANSMILTPLEEEAIVQYILELTARSFPPRLYSVEEMANQLLQERNMPSVGKNWTSRFVIRRPELCMRWVRTKDY